MKMNLCLYAFVLLLNLIIIQYNTKPVLSVSSDNHEVATTSNNNNNNNSSSNYVGINSKKRCPDKEESMHSKKLINGRGAGAAGVINKDNELAHYKAKLPHRFCNNVTHCGHWKNRFWLPRGCFYQDVTPSDAR